MRKTGHVQDARRYVFTATVQRERYRVSAREERASIGEDNRARFVFTVTVQREREERIAAHLDRYVSKTACRALTYLSYPSVGCQQSKSTGEF